MRLFSFKKLYTHQIYIDLFLLNDLIIDYIYCKWVLNNSHTNKVYIVSFTWSNGIGTSASSWADKVAEQQKGRDSANRLGKARQCTVLHWKWVGLDKIRHIITIKFLLIFIILYRGIYKEIRRRWRRL